MSSRAHTAEADFFGRLAAGARADIHGANERVLQDQSEKATPAEADFFGRLAAGDAR